MINYSTKEERDAYFESENLNQSKAKTYLTFKTYDNKEEELFYEEKEHFVIGNGVDAKLTTLDFDAEFYVPDSTVHKPTESILNVIHYLYHLNKGVLFKDLSDDTIIKACEDQKYQSTYKNDTKVSKISEYSDYYDLLIKANERVILSDEQFKKIDRIVSDLKDNPATSYYLNDNQFDENVDTYYQLPIYFEWNGVPCKALLDKLIVNHYEKKVTICDIKSMGAPVITFPKSADRFGYYFQAGWYSQAVNAWLVKKGLVDYTFDNFKFIVSSTANVQSAVFSLDWTSIDLVINGYHTNEYTCESIDGKSKISKKIRGYSCLDALNAYYNDEDGAVPGTTILKRFEYDVPINLLGIIE